MDKEIDMWRREVRRINALIPSSLPPITISRQLRGGELDLEGEVKTW